MLYLGGSDLDQTIGSVELCTWGLRSPLQSSSSHSVGTCGSALCQPVLWTGGCDRDNPTACQQ